MATFEESYKDIAVIVEKLRTRWRYTASSMEDFEDIKSKIITHIWQKWSLYDQTKPLGGWVATVAQHQLRNILRDLYLSTSSPCARCPANLGGNLCSLFGEQGVECDIYKKWYNKKRHIHEAKMPYSLEECSVEVESKVDTSFNWHETVKGLHLKIQPYMTKKEWEIYRRIYLEEMSEEACAAQLGFKTTEVGRKIGYKRIRQVQTLAVKIAKKIISEIGMEGLV
jgi:hypothetical protein